MPATRTLPRHMDVAVEVRRATPSDVPAIRAMHERCSDESVRYRYLGAAVADRRMLELVRRTDTLIAVIDDRIVAMGNLAIRDRVADLALLVEDAYQSAGVGTALGRMLVEHAMAEGAHTLTAATTGTNHRVSALIASWELPMTVKHESGTTYITCRLDDLVPQPRWLEHEAV